MFLSDVTNDGITAALVKTLSFQEARLRMIAENVANAETPGYRTKQLDVKGFQQALGDALETRSRNPQKPLAIDNGRELRTDESGRLRVVPSEKPVDNVLFHDGTNVSIEREMADLAETGLAQQLATTLLRSQMAGLRKAIRGIV